MPLLYKYLKQKNYDTFKSKGLVYINTLYNLRTSDITIKDELEGHQIVEVPKDHQPLELNGKEFHDLMPFLNINKKQESNIRVTMESGVSFKFQVTDAYIFCTSMKIDKKIMDKFGYDTYYTIKNPELFANTLFDRLNESTTLRGYRIKKVQYANKCTPLTSDNKQNVIHNPNRFWDACFSKPESYKGEYEFRMLFIPKFRKKLEPMLIECPELRQHCSFLKKSFR
jgi:hypothetical protein